MPGRTAAVLLTEVVQQAEAVQHQFRRNRASAKVTQVFKCGSLSLQLAPVLLQFLDVQHLIQDLVALFKNLKCK
jgi:hypothetical protein